MVYPDFREKSDIRICDSQRIRQQVKDLWKKLPSLRDSMKNVPTLHVPNKRQVIRGALENDNFKVQTKKQTGAFSYPC